MRRITKNIMKEETYFINDLLDIGEYMMNSGAEIYRIEDTLSRMGLAYGAARMNVFVITSSIVVTLTMPDQSMYTQTRRIRSSGSTNFEILDQLNTLSRSYCSDKIDAGKLHDKIQAICSARPDRRCFYLGSMLAAGGFAVFFGGSIYDGIAAAFAAVSLCLLQEYGSALFPNKIIFHLISSFLVGIFICLSGMLFSGLHISKIMIGTIMLLIPGIAMTNSIRDILVGDTISGIMRLIETLFWAGALAFGFMGAILLTGGNV